MLVEIARALEVDVRIFFDDLVAQTRSTAAESVNNELLKGALKAPREVALLSPAYLSINNRGLRKNILRLVQTISETELGNNEADLPGA